ncbi:MAG TPA: type II secretion system F family protein [Nocardioides sp.]|uniref:type II secretion system F family protein n=1 Tax=Nocardioides sp. TaxID=35761 RepID=UPI002D7ED230|nr:type II secretion system F family protein [Nocardioides sp.]HET6651727.1 type II secretion system F family protein [Nocardioides sp.]
MALSTTLLLIVLLGAVVGGGVVLLVNGLTRHEASAVAKPPSGLGRRLRAFGTRLPIAIGVGLLVLLVTRWIVAAVATGLLILFWDALFGGAGAEKRGIAKIEALAAWTESLRDTVAGAVGLEQAIPATAYAASPIIAGELSTMADRLRVRVPLPVALQRFAEDMDDASADLIIAALILNSRLRGPGLREVLTSLSESARAELDMRQRVSAGRRSTRRSVQIVVGVTLTFVFGLRIFNPGYVEPYGSPVGQVVLLIVIGVFAAGVMWLRRLSRFETPERFLHFRTAP